MSKNEPRDVTRPPAGGVKSARPEIDAFLAAARSVPASAGVRGRLVFALDATMSRQPSWDRACRLQAEMFDATDKIGGLDVQLVYFRGMGECRASRWVGQAAALRDLMTGIDCRGGHTQIGKVLAHVRRETAKRRVQALIYIGDAMEEPIDDLAAGAGELGLLGVPAFLFQEGGDPEVEAGFREIARLTRGAYVRFDQSAAGELAQLLRAVAIYASGGRRALEAAGGAGARLLIGQLK